MNADYQAYYFSNGVHINSLFITSAESEEEAIDRTEAFAKETLNLWNDVRYDLVKVIARKYIDTKN